MSNDIGKFISEIYPFFIKIKNDSLIEEYGKSLYKTIPNILNLPFNQHFIIIRPSENGWDFDTLKQSEKQLIILQSTDCPDLTLRGEIKYEPSENVIYFLGSPWVLNIDTLKHIGLSFSDFSPSDSMTDVLGISEQYQTSIEDTFDLVTQLRDQTDKNNKIFDSLAEIIFQTNNDGNWTFLNKAWEKTMGYTVDESINTLFFNYIHPDDVQRNRDLFSPLINKEKSYCNHQIRYITKNKEIKWIRVFATLIIDQNNETQGTTGTLMDITKEVKSENQLSLILNNVKDEISLVDAELNYTFISPSLAQNRGFDSPEEMKIFKLNETMHPEDFEKSNTIFKDGAMQFEGEYRLKMKNGEYKWYHGLSKIIEDNTTNKKYLLTVARNIESRKKAQLQIEQALEKEKELNRLKTEFITTSSHEFKTPLAIIKNNIEILLKSTQNQLEGDVKLLHNKFLSRIDNEAERMLQLINDTLILEKANNNILSIKKVRVDLFELIARVVERFNLLQKDGRNIKINLINNPRTIYADKDLLDHVFQNLISNAFKYSEGKINPEITIIYKKKIAEVIIKDYGIGIPERDIEKLFIPFNRASNTQGIPGTGMGLSIVKKILDLHESVINIESRLNEGTSFKLELPYNSKE